MVGVVAAPARHEVLGLSIHLLTMDGDARRGGTDAPLHHLGPDGPTHRPGTDVPIHHAGTDVPIHRRGPGVHLHHGGLDALSGGPNTHAVSLHPGRGLHTHRSGSDVPSHHRGTAVPTLGPGAGTAGCLRVPWTVHFPPSMLIGGGLPSVVGGAPKL